MSPFPANAHARWRALRDTERRIIPIVHAHAMTRWSAQIVISGWRMFAQGSSTDKSWTRARPLFDSWFAFGFRPRLPELDLDDEETRGWPITSLAIDWAQTTPDVSDEDRIFVEAAGRSPWSLLLVHDVQPGLALDLRDLLTGRTLTIFEPEISLRAEPDQILVSAVLTLDGLSMLLGPAPFAMPGEWRNEAREMREPEGDREWVPLDELQSFSFEIFTAYRRACEDEDNEGDNEYAPLRTCAYRVSEWAPTLLRWRLTSDVVETIEALKPLVMYDTSEEIWLELGPEGVPRAEGVWCRPTPDEPDDWQSLGFLHVEEGRLSAEVPTPGRADELELAVARVLPGAELIERRSEGTVVRVME